MVAEDEYWTASVAQIAVIEVNTCSIATTVQRDVTEAIGHWTATKVPIGAIVANTIWTETGVQTGDTAAIGRWTDRTVQMHSTSRNRLVAIAERIWPANKIAGSMILARLRQSRGVTVETDWTAHPHPPHHSGVNLWISPSVLLFLRIAPMMVCTF